MARQPGLQGREFRDQHKFFNINKTFLKYLYNESLLETKEGDLETSLMLGADSQSSYNTVVNTWISLGQISRRSFNIRVGVSLLT